MISGKEAPIPGEGKNAWLTGTAAWTFLGVSQGILGIQPDYDGLRVDPCIPGDWPGFKATRTFRGAIYHITVENPHAVSKGVGEIHVNGLRVEGNKIPLAPAGSDCHVVVSLAAGPLATAS